MPNFHLTEPIGEQLEAASRKSPHAAFLVPVARVRSVLSPGETHVGELGVETFTDVPRAVSMAMSAFVVSRSGSDSLGPVLTSLVKQVSLLRGMHTADVPIPRVALDTCLTLILVGGRESETLVPAVEAIESVPEFRWERGLTTSSHFSQAIATLVRLGRTAGIIEVLDAIRCAETRAIVLGRLYGAIDHRTDKTFVDALRVRFSELASPEHLDQEWSTAGLIKDVVLADMALGNPLCPEVPDAEDLIEHEVDLMGARCGKSFGNWIGRSDEHWFSRVDCPPEIDVVRDRFFQARSWWDALSFLDEFVSGWLRFDTEHAMALGLFINHLIDACDDGSHGNFPKQGEYLVEARIVVLTLSGILRGSGLREAKQFLASWTEEVAESFGPFQACIRLGALATRCEDFGVPALIPAIAAQMEETFPLCDIAFIDTPLPNSLRLGEFRILVAAAKTFTYHGCRRTAQALDRRLSQSKHVDEAEWNVWKAVESIYLERTGDVPVYIQAARTAFADIDAEVVSESLDFEVSDAELPPEIAAALRRQASPSPEFQRFKTELYLAEGLAHGNAIINAAEILRGAFELLTQLEAVEQGLAVNSLMAQAFSMWVREERRRCPKEAELLSAI